MWHEPARIRTTIGEAWSRLGDGGIATVEVF
jgi:hypothetical protein